MDIVVDDLYHSDQQSITQGTNAHGLIIVQFEAHQHHHNGYQSECDALGYASLSCVHIIASVVYALDATFGGHIQVF